MARTAVQLLHQPINILVERLARDIQCRLDVSALSNDLAPFVEASSAGDGGLVLELKD